MDIWGASPDGPLYIPLLKSVCLKTASEIQGWNTQFLPSEVLFEGRWMVTTPSYYSVVLWWEYEYKAIITWRNNIWIRLRWAHGRLLEKGNLFFFFIRQNSLGYAVGTNKPNSQCLNTTNVYFSQRLHVQNVLVGKLMYFHDPDAAMGREWLIMHWHLEFYWSKQISKGGL